uniref:XRE family transcriptional regulator n=1 Tax=Streptomyces sp. NBC_01401 TaxID=2903854 RepID=A0AAU3H128_9ACTN
MSAGDDRGRGGSLAERLNTLFAMVRWGDVHGRQREYSTAEVAKAVTADPSHAATLSRSYLAMLRNGSHTNPTLSVLEGLVKFFDDHRAPGTAPVTIQSLVAESDPEDELLRQRLASSQVRMIAMRAGAMTPTMREQLIQMIERFDQEASADPGTQA